MRVAFTAVATLALMGCNFADSGAKDQQQAKPAETAQAPAPDQNLADSMASSDPQPLPADGNAMFPAPGTPIGDAMASNNGQGGLQMASATSANGATSKAQQTPNGSGTGTMAASADGVAKEFPMMQAQVVLDRLGFTIGGAVEGVEGWGVLGAGTLTLVGSPNERSLKSLPPLPSRPT